MSFIKKSKIVVICGPTGIGKTSLAIKTAKLFSGEIISADSMQIYRYMNIGTAKPTLAEQTAVFHHMIDIIDPDEQFDAADFAAKARNVIAELCEKDILPFVVGGTGFYIKALQHGLFRARPADQKILIRLKEEAIKFGSSALHSRLEEIDSDAAHKIHCNDTFRIVRALETFESTGKKISEYQKEHNFGDNLFDVLKIGLAVDRNRLYERINKRVDLMLESGFADEVKNLLEKGYNKNLKAMQSIGYRHLVEFIKGQSSWEKTVRLFKRDTRRYAKRQLTWFNADPEIIWLDPAEIDQATKLIKKFIVV
ncbi:tRNA dimethylallyltransferase [Desulfosarcina sp. BuS5]|uniref:tRNA (adenosine(37)-N6)-dimethylallyltransferase MiaA n=1 Tax=Desulfosarcina sp. BuS5 TaxID=933262 RepID=UPI000A4D4DD9|nr:tRNA (adenosine(37)-N6)-dimethylallyltransferase MiaA [Desulfosarcina sp. BuS5]WDN90455.1 tRNA dimethylallyltransferase [Desulfosarcina sp. BuS5]